MEVYYERRFKEGKLEIPPALKKELISYFNPTDVEKQSSRYMVGKSNPICAGVLLCSDCLIHHITTEMECCRDILNRLVPGITKVITFYSDEYEWNTENNKKARELLKKLRDAIRKFKRIEIKKGV